MPKKKNGKNAKKAAKKGLVLCSSFTDECELVELEGRSRALPVITFPHAKIHHGRSFYVNFMQTIFLSEAYEVHIRVGDCKPHCLFDIDSTGGTHVQFYEGTEKMPGMPIPAFNRDRNSSNLPNLSVSVLPNGENGDGTLIWDGSFGNWRSPVQRDFDQELILKPNTDYLGRVSSFTDGNRVNMALSWYEETVWPEDD